MPINLDEDFLSPFSQYYSNDDEISYDDSPEELLDPPPGSDEVKFSTNFTFYFLFYFIFLL